jgi:hypothetical protein
MFKELTPLKIDILHGIYAGCVDFIANYFAFIGNCEHLMSEAGLSRSKRNRLLK